MHCNNLFSPIKVISTVMLLLSMIFCVPSRAAIAHHGAAIFKTPMGPDGNAADPRAGVGDTVTAIITIKNADQNAFGGRADSLTLTSLVDTVFHKSGSFSHIMGVPSNTVHTVTVGLLGGTVITNFTLTSNLFPFTLPRLSDFVTVTDTYQVLAGDPDLPDG